MGERPREAWGCIQGGGPRGPRGDGSQGFRVSSCNNCTRPVLRPLGTSPQEGCGGVPAVQPGQTQFFPGHKVEDRRAPPSSGPSLTLQAAAPAVSPALPGWAFLPSVPHDTAGLGACYRRGPDVGSQSVCVVPTWWGDTSGPARLESRAAQGPPGPRHSRPPLFRDRKIPSHPDPPPWVPGPCHGVQST